MHIKNSIIFLCAAYFVLLPGISAAQEVSWIVNGKVYEKGSRKPLQGVALAVRELDSITGSSDENGLFSLTLPGPGNYTVTALALGAEKYESRDIQLAANIAPPQLVFYLRPPTILAEIVVNAERNPNRVSKTIMEANEIRQIAGSGSDPLAALQSLPGVTFTGGSSAPAIRGSGPEDNFYYVDSIPVFKLFHFYGNSIFNADLVDNFNLYSAAFAPDNHNAIGAVLDVTLRNPRSDKIGGKVNVSLLSADLLLEGPASNNQSFYFAARRSYFDLLIGSITEKGVTVQIPNYSDYLGKYIWNVNDDNRLSMHISGATDSLKFYTASDADVVKTEPDIVGASSIQDASTTQAVTWDSRLGAGISNKLVVGRIQLKSDTIVGAAVNVNLVENIIFVREQLRMPINAQHELTLASNLSSHRYGVDVNFKNPACTQFNTGCDLSSSPRVQLNETFEFFSWDASAQDRWRIVPSLALIGGVRHSGDNYLKQSYTEPRLGLEWEWSEHTLLTAGWGKHNQAPNAQEVAKNFGNPQLSNLRADHSVLGINHKFNPDWSLKAEAYYKKFSGLVVGVSDPGINYLNGASGAAYGTELLIKKEASERLSGWLAFTLAKSERRNDLSGESFRFEYDQPVNASLITNYKLTHEWTINSKWSYNSGKPYTPIVGTNGSYPDGRPIPAFAGINSGTLPDYHRLDLRLSRNYIFDSWKLITYFELNNVYQRKNVAGYDYGANYDKKEEVPVFYLPFSFGVQGEF